MPIYLGNQRFTKIFLNDNSSEHPNSSRIRNVYFGHNLIMGFVYSDYTANELVPFKPQAGDYPEIIEGNNTLSIRTKNYNPGGALSKYYCDWVTVRFDMSGEFTLTDEDGNQVLSITQQTTFSITTGEYSYTTRTVGRNGRVLINSTVKSMNFNPEWLSYSIFYDSDFRHWCVEYKGVIYSCSGPDKEDWKPTYFSIICRPRVIGTSITNGSVILTNMLRAKGYPDAN